MTPARIPMNGFAILLNAMVFTSLSAMDGISVVTNPVERSVVSMSQEARAAIPPVPSFLSDIPTPTPIAKRIAMLSIKAPPAFTRNRPIRLAAPGCHHPAWLQDRAGIRYPSGYHRSAAQLLGALTLYPTFEETSYFPSLRKIY